MMSPDTILRSDAIEQIYQAYGRPSDDEVFIRMREALERVPWVSPLTFETNSKEYKMPDGRTAVFEYSDDGIGRITLENMDMLMGMLADRPQGEWVPFEYGDERWHKCTACGVADRYIEYVERPNGTTGKLVAIRNYCPNCGADMRKGADDGNQ